MLETILTQHMGVDQARFRIIPFEGKQDLDKNIKKKIQGWRIPNTTFLIVRDQDSGDCKKIKDELIKRCVDAGKADTIVCIACHELETFYLGDLQAIEKGYEITGLHRKQGERKYRLPDSLGNPAQELVKITQGKYQKLEGARIISKSLNLQNNNSISFQYLLQSLRKTVK